MTTEEAIAEKVRALPAEKQEDVLRYVLRIEAEATPAPASKRDDIDEEVARLAGGVPEDRRTEFLQWAEWLKAGSPGGPPFPNLLGVCADFGPGPSEEDIAEARREMWGEYMADAER